jgi:6-phosphogluconolactonase
MKAEVIRFTEAEAWATAFTKAFIECAEEALAKGRPAFHAALSGGKTPAPLYRALASSPELKATAARLPIHLWIVDERFVPPGDPRRNDRLVTESFEDARSWPSPPEIHPWPKGERDAACATYADEIRAFLGPKPSFDFTVLGMGADGHTAGLFTVDQVRNAGGDLTLSTEAPAEPRLRMTMGPDLLARSKVTLVALAGHGKEGMLRAILGGLCVPLSLVAPENTRFYHLEA